MLVHVLSAYPVQSDNFAFSWLQESAALDPFKQHQLTDDPAAADIILFMESHWENDPYCLAIMKHPLYRRYAEKCFVYHDSDFAVPVMRGFYPSIRRRDYSPDRCRGAAYLARIANNPDIRHVPGSSGGKWLYTFIGESNSPVRAELLKREHPQGMMRDTTGRRLWQIESAEERAAFTRSYAEAIIDSRFVLCPAGIGPSSYRLFETMEMGRVPVILSDDWMAPHGPRWDNCSLHLPESCVPDLESILAQHVPRQPEMARRAREEWERWFDKPVCFHHLAEMGAELKRTPVATFSKARAYASLLKPHHRRIFLGALSREWKAKLRGRPTHS